MPVNNFKELEKEQERSFSDSDQRIKKNVNYSIGFFQFIGDIIDLFMPKVVNMFLNLSGGQGPKADSNIIDKKEDDDDDAERATDNEFRPRYPNTL